MEIDLTFPSWNTPVYFSPDLILGGYVRFQELGPSLPVVSSFVLTIMSLTSTKWQIYALSSPEKTVYAAHEQYPEHA